MPTAQFVFDLGGSECISTLEAATDGISDGLAAVVLGQFMVDAWIPYMATQCTFREVRFADAVVVRDAAGEGETNSLPANCALIVQKNTGTSVRGRMFLPGLAEADCDAGGRVGSELRGLVDTLFSDALAAMIADGVIPKVKSEVGAGSATNITSFRCRPLVATLRNRVVTR